MRPRRSLFVRAVDELAGVDPYNRTGARVGVPAKDSAMERFNSPPSAAASAQNELLELAAGVLRQWRDFEERRVKALELIAASCSDAVSALRVKG